MAGQVAVCVQGVRAQKLCAFIQCSRCCAYIDIAAVGHMALVPTTPLGSLACCAACPAGGGRGAAKTHLPTNEAALKQLATKHELPGLVLEHRCVCVLRLVLANSLSCHACSSCQWCKLLDLLQAYGAARQPSPAAMCTSTPVDATRVRFLLPRACRCIVNVMSKWIDAQWVQQAAAGGRVRSSWQQASTATGRLSSCSPNLQAGQQPTAGHGGQLPASPIATLFASNCVPTLMIVRHACHCYSPKKPPAASIHDNLMANTMPPLTCRQ